MAEQKIDKDKLKIRYALFAYGGVTSHTAEWLAETAFWAAESGIRFHSISADSSATISSNRSKALAKFMQKTDDNVLLMVDRDMVWNDVSMPVDLCAMALAVDSVVSVVASKKGFGIGIVGSKADGSPAELGTPELQLSQACGTGIMAIPRSVIDRATPKASAYFETASQIVDINQYNLGVAPCREKDGGTYHNWFGPCLAYRASEGWMEIQEDIAFCLRMRNAGEKVYVTDKYNIGHVGDHIFYPKDGASNGKG